jgi:hypothetical protein
VHPVLQRTQTELKTQKKNYADVASCKFFARHPKSILSLRGCLKSRLRVTDHRGVMPITLNTDKLYDTDLTDAAWALMSLRYSSSDTGI